MGLGVKMTTSQKVILYNLIMLQVMKDMPMTRGSGRSLLYWDHLWRYHAAKRTEFCLAALGETIMDILPGDHPAREYDDEN